MNKKEKQELKEKEERERAEKYSKQDMEIRGLRAENVELKAKIEMGTEENQRIVVFLEAEKDELEASIETLLEEVKDLRDFKKGVENRILIAKNFVDIMEGHTRKWA